jgi:hypothetical protein
VRREPPAAPPKHRSDDRAELLLTNGSVEQTRQQRRGQHVPRVPRGNQQFGEQVCVGGSEVWRYVRLPDPPQQPCRTRRQLAVLPERRRGVCRERGTASRLHACPPRDGEQSGGVEQRGRRVARGGAAYV